MRIRRTTPPNREFCANHRIEPMTPTARRAPADTRFGIAAGTV